MTIDTGVRVELPPHTCGMLVPKSGLNVRASIVDWGLIDEGYSGTIAVKLYNLGKLPHFFDRRDKIAQLVVVPVLYPQLRESDEILGGERGENGFGSSGK